MIGVTKFVLIVYMGLLPATPSGVQRLKDPKIIAQFDTYEECQAMRSRMDLKPGQFSVCATDNDYDGEED